MEQEIKDIIAKNLPAHVGDVLKTRLEQADMDKAAVLKLRRDLEACYGEIITLKELVANLENYKQANLNLLDRVKVVESREMALDLATANIKLAESEKRSSELYGLVQMVFRSPIYRQKIQNDIFSGYRDGHHTITGGTPNTIESTTE